MGVTRAQFRSRLLGVVAAGTGVFLLAGCAWSASLKTREATVYFVDGATEAQKAAARAACTGLTHATPEPIATDALSTRAHTEIRFRVDDANDNELATLFGCLQKQPAVRTVLAPDTVGANNN